MLLKHERYYGLGMDALVSRCSRKTNVTMHWAWILWLAGALGTRTFLWFGHGCSGYHMLLKHEHYYGLGMDALVVVCCWNTNVVMVWAWMLWLLYAVGTLSSSGLCSWKFRGIRIVLWEHEQSCTRNHEDVLNRRASYRRRFHELAA